MKKFLLALFLAAALAGLSACDDNDSGYNNGSLYSRIVGRRWIGDLGMTDRYNIPLESGVYFGSDGFGTDDLYYYNNGGSAGTLNILWDAYGGTIYIDYGREAAPREVRNVYFFHPYELTGDLYVYGVYYGPTILYME